MPRSRASTPDRILAIYLREMEQGQARPVLDQIARSIEDHTPMFYSPTLDVAIEHAIEHGTIEPSEGHMIIDELRRAVPKATDHATHRRMAIGAGAAVALIAASIAASRAVGKRRR